VIPPALLVKDAAIAFVPLATVAVLWPIVTRPWLMSRLLSDSAGTLSVGRIQMLVTATATLATAMTSSDAQTKGIVTGLFGLSHAGYLIPKYLGVRAQLKGDQ
jgi:hypothetical protein